MPKCPECCVSFEPKSNHKAHKCECGSLLVLSANGEWREHKGIHSTETTAEERIDIPPDWDVGEWIGVGERKTLRHEVTAVDAPILARRNNQGYWIGKPFQEPKVIESEHHAEVVPVFQTLPKPFFEKAPPKEPIYRQPPREKIGKSGSDWRGDCGESASSRYLRKPTKEY